jgi:hypothetical protein
MKLSLPALLDAGRRSFLIAGVALATALAFPAPGALAQDWTTERWVGTWGAGPGGPPLPANTQTFTDQTLRLIVHSSIGGNRVRIRISNEMGSTPLRIGAAHIALRAGGADIQAGTDRALTFSGNASITIPPGAPVLSDPVDLNVPALSDLAISLYLPGTVGATTIHGTASQTNYVSLPGNFTGAASLADRAHDPVLALPDRGRRRRRPGRAAPPSWRWATRSPTAPAARPTPTTAGPTGWRAACRPCSDPILGINTRLGVVNRGISGNRLLSNPPEGSLAGRSIQERFDRDVLAAAGVRYMT